MAKVYEQIAASLQAVRNCAKANPVNDAWRAAHYERVLLIMRECLPHGSGFDGECTVDAERSNETRIVIGTSYHHMNEHGFYDGWTDHSVIVTPTFDGITVRVTGVNRRGIKDYVAECFYGALCTELTETQVNAICAIIP